MRERHIGRDDRTEGSCKKKRRKKALMTVLARCSFIENVPAAISHLTILMVLHVKHQRDKGKRGRRRGRGRRRPRSNVSQK